MNSPEIVAALRERVPEAPGELYDSQADALYQYCWLMLRNRETSQVAVRDAIVAAEAHIGRLADPELLKPWLFALARVECCRRPPAPAGETDEPLARPEQADADLRVMAWNSVMALEPAEREALDLVSRHGMEAAEVALVLDMAPSDTRDLLESARHRLEQALAAEILVSRPSHECAGRTEAMNGWAGTVTPAIRQRLLRHAGACPVCLPHLPRNVSAARVFSLIPRPALTRAARARVLNCFSDPELAGYRTFAAARLAAFDAAGFPVAGPAPDMMAAAPAAEAAVVAAAAPMVAASAASAAGAGPGARRGQRVLAGFGAAAAAMAVAAAFVFGGLGGKFGLDDGAPGLAPGAGGSPAMGLQGSGATPSAIGDAARLRDRRTAGSASRSQAVNGRGLVVPSSASAAIPIAVPPRVPQRGMPVPLPGLPGSTIPYQSPTPSPSSELQISPASLSLGTGSGGQLVLTAVGGSVTWTASASSGDVSLSATTGRLSAGQSVTVNVTVTRRNGAGGRATLLIGPGSASVPVTWAATSSPSPSPSSSPTSSSPSGGGTPNPGGPFRSGPPARSPAPSRSPGTSPSASSPSASSAPPSSASPSAAPSSSATASSSPASSSPSASASR